MTRSGRSEARGEPRTVLAIKPFRRFWLVLSLSSLGDWLSLLALMSMAAMLTADQAAWLQGTAVSAVVVVQLLPTLVLGPIAGALADRFDRRLNMVVGDILRALLYISMPLVGELWWLLIANFLAQTVSLFWAPAKEATVPNLVPRQRLEEANRLFLVTTYGSMPIAAGLYTLLATVGTVSVRLFPDFALNQNDIALFLNGATYLVAALVVFRLPIPPMQPTEGERQPSVWRQIVDGWRFAASTPVVRGLLVGMLGAFAAGGLVVGVARLYVTLLQAGDAGFGILVGSVFTGMALGMFVAPRVVRDFSRYRLFGLAIAASGVALLLMALIPNMVIAAFLTGTVGAGAGIAWMIGLTLLGTEVSDEIRGRTFAFLQAMAKVVLMVAVAAGPILGGLIPNRTQRLGADIALTFGGSNVVLLVGAAIALLVGWYSYTQMDDRRGTSLIADVVTAVRGAPPDVAAKRTSGTLIALEGGEGAGKSTQARLLAIWLREQGYDVVATHEPGATKVGMRLRAILLDRNHVGLSPRAEALLYCADRAEHVESVIRPALERGAVVVTDRYIDSMVAYQGAGRQLPEDEIVWLNRWATDNLLPDLTIVLDLPPSEGSARRGAPADRLEAESEDFHERVRSGFQARARSEPDRYFVVDASEPAEAVSRAIQDEVRRILPDPVPDSSEEATTTFPAIKIE
ncbi:dTMP kinase [Allonocardiopsis opalescens]|uniref:Thymidylate kinase n=1 Tax=Allonocardiopsis opalescens TaxID=1144618 RepID=A0A2T0Q256_9ACTN|nr:dTMP kinase [Allonocardiopsis opalescens]PRX97886.1 thymidylate kinase [Allonocardiopsis opalescens]